MNSHSQLQVFVSVNSVESTLEHCPVQVRDRVWTPSSHVLLQSDQSLHSDKVSASEFFVSDIHF